MSYGGSFSRGEDRLAKFVGQKRLKPYISEDLTDRTVKPINFKTTQGGSAYGYRAFLALALGFLWPPLSCRLYRVLSPYGRNSSDTLATPFHSNCFGQHKRPL